jgi:hypothetical protein
MWLGKSELRDTRNRARLPNSASAMTADLLLSFAIVRELLLRKLTAMKANFNIELAEAPNLESTMAIELKKFGVVGIKPRRP